MAHVTAEQVASGVLREHLCVKCDSTRTFEKAGWNAGERKAGLDNLDFQNLYFGVHLKLMI